MYIRARDRVIIHGHRICCWRAHASQVTFCFLVPPLAILIRSSYIGSISLSTASLCTCYTKTHTQHLITASIYFAKKNSRIEQQRHTAEKKLKSNFSICFSLCFDLQHTPNDKMHLSECIYVI